VATNGEEFTLEVRVNGDLIMGFPRKIEFSSPYTPPTTTAVESARGSVPDGVTRESATSMDG